MLNLPNALFLIGTIAGLCYWVYGLAAANHIEDAEERKSPDRYLSSLSVWSLSTTGYTEAGQRLCKKGNTALVITVAAWVGWVLAK